MNNELLTPKEVAALLKISIHTIHAGTRPGAEKPFPIKPIKVGNGRLLRFRKSDVEAYLAAL